MSDSDDLDYSDGFEGSREVIENADITEEFRNAIMNAKRSLNDNIISGPELETREAQDLNVLNDYIKSLNNLYILSLNAQKGIFNDKDLKLFPQESQDAVKIAIYSIIDVFKNKSIADTIPYKNYIWYSFKENQFVLNDKF